MLGSGIISKEDHDGDECFEDLLIRDVCLSVPQIWKEIGPVFQRSDIISAFSTRASGIVLEEI